MWRCADNIVGYCKEEPDWDENVNWVTDIETGEPKYCYGGTCKKSHKNCGLYYVLGDKYAPKTKAKKVRSVK